MARSALVVWLALVVVAAAVKVKVVMHSEQEDSKPEEEERVEPWEHKKRDVTMLPFIKAQQRKRAEEKAVDFEEEKPTTEKARQMHPNELIFPLIYKQSHINSMFKFGENWYTWSTEKRTDGTKATNYFICYDEPKRCDEIGWERTDALPQCAFQIDSLMPQDRACINPFGVEPHASGTCDGAEQMKVSEMLRACGPRIRSLWRFLRVRRRPTSATKPADVNSLICEDEEECFITIEYRIHHDRITFSLHEPSRGQTFKSALKRDIAEEEAKTTSTTSERSRVSVRRGRKHEHEREREHSARAQEEAPAPALPKFRARSRSKPVEGKGVVKERNDSGYSRRVGKNKIKVREDVSDDISE